MFKIKNLMFTVLLAMSFGAFGSDYQKIADALQTLGLSYSSSPSDLEKTYKKLALQFHPDKNIGNEQAVSKFQEIQQAYVVLKENFANPQPKFFEQLDAEKIREEQLLLRAKKVFTGNALSEQMKSCEEEYQKALNLLTARHAENMQIVNNNIKLLENSERALNYNYQNRTKVIGIIRHGVCYDITPDQEPATIEYKLKKAQIFNKKQNQINSKSVFIQQYNDLKASLDHAKAQTIEDCKINIKQREEKIEQDQNNLYYLLKFGNALTPQQMQARDALLDEHRKWLNEYTIVMHAQQAKFVEGALKDRDVQEQEWLKEYEQDSVKIDEQHKRLLKEKFAKARNIQESMLLQVHDNLSNKYLFEHISFPKELHDQIAAIYVQRKNEKQRKDKSKQLFGEHTLVAKKCLDELDGVIALCAQQNAMIKQSKNGLMGRLRTMFKAPVTSEMQLINLQQKELDERKLIGEAERTQFARFKN